LEHLLELVKSVSIENLLNQRDAALSRYLQALALLAEADEIAAGANLGRPSISLEHNAGYNSRMGAFTGEYARENKQDVASELQAIIDAGAWKYLMDESGMRSFMSAKKRAEWDNQIHGKKKDIVPLTRENIASTFEHLYDNRVDMMEQGVIECFKALSWSYKTNQPVKFGKRIIMNYFLHDIGSPNYDRCNQVDDLVRLLARLDDKPEPDHRNATYSGVSVAMRKRDPELTTDYLQIRWYASAKTAHITFNRPDLVDRLNAILAKHYPGALPSPR
jgi:hypothetical protein